MKTRARVLTTMDCNRACAGCINTMPVFDQRQVIKSITDIPGYDEYILTGGEPLLYPGLLFDTIQRIQGMAPDARLCLYSSLYVEDVYTLLLRDQIISGLTFTLHYDGLRGRDVSDLKKLSALLVKLKDRVISDHSFWLSIDSRCYDLFDFSNIDFSGWDVVRKLTWLDDCSSLSTGEELFLLDS